jgi:hypothetical protein
VTVCHLVTKILSSTIRLGIKLFVVFLNKGNLHGDGNDSTNVNLVRVYSFVRELDSKGKLNYRDAEQIYYK